MLFLKLLSIIVLHCNLIPVFGDLVTSEVENFQNVYTNPKLCGSTTVSYTTQTLQYTWQIRNIFSYLTFVDNYAENFTHQIDDIKFASNEGIWSFRIQANKKPNTEAPQAFVSVIFKRDNSVAYENNTIIGIKAQISLDSMNANDVMEEKYMEFPIRNLVQNYTEIYPGKYEIQSISNPKSSMSDSTPATIIIEAGSSKRRSRTKRSPWFISALTPEDSDQFFHFHKNGKTERQNKSVQVLIYESSDIQYILNTFIENESYRFKADSIYISFLIMLASPNNPMKVEKLHCPVFGVKSPVKFVSSITNTIANVDPQFSSSKTSYATDPRSPPFIHNMKNLLGSTLYSDLVLNIQGHQFHAHRIILASSSEKFFELIKNANTSTLMQNGGFTLDLHNLKISKSSMFEILRYLYTGEINDMSNFAKEIAIGANYFKISSLKSLAVDFILKQINLENAVELYSLSKEISAPKLTKASLNFIKKNRKRLIGQSDDFQNLASKHPTLMFELFIS